MTIDKNKCFLTINSIFVSSTIDDLTEYRKQVLTLLPRKCCIPICQEYFFPGPKPDMITIGHYMKQCDAVILILGNRYGSIAENNISFVEMEYEFAINNDIFVSPLIYKGFNHDSKHLTINNEDKLQEKFISKVIKNHTYQTFSNDQEFEREANEAINGIQTKFKNKSVFTNSIILQNELREKDRELRKQKIEIENHTKHRELLKNLMVLKFEIMDATFCTHKYHSKIQEDSKVALKEILNEDVALASLINQIISDCADRPILIDIATKKLAKFKKELNGITDHENGYKPRDNSELELVVQNLFSPTLLKLRATSVQFDPKKANDDIRPALEAAQSYWTDTGFGQLFSNKNKNYLQNGGKVQRLFICDSITDAVNEEWFKDHVIKQIELGADVKVLEIEKEKLHYFMDYGIYTHRVSDGGDQDYLLFIDGKEQYNHRCKPALISPTPQRFIHEFDTWWSQQKETLKIIEHTKDNYFKSTTDGYCKINELFNNRIILRNMKRLDTGEKLLGTDSGFVRKYENNYAVAVDRHLRSNFDFDNVMYFGDTYKNDGGFIRNIQKLNNNYSASGFICEPNLHLNNLWFNSIYFTSKWTDVLTYLNLIKDNITSKSLAIFDIDQTLWAAKGQNENPINLSRINAIIKLIDRYTKKESKHSTHLSSIVGIIYNSIKGIEYIKLTLDNEDYKAAITICLLFSLYEGGFTDPGNPFLPDSFNSHDLDWAINKILHKYVEEGGIEAFIVSCLGEVFTDACVSHCLKYQLDIETIRDDIRSLHRNIRAKIPAPYTAFRKLELEEAIRLTDKGSLEDISTTLTINTTMWNVADYLSKNGIPIVGLSDRPDESTYDTNGNSLLDTPMLKYGDDIREPLVNIDIFQR